MSKNSISPEYDLVIRHCSYLGPDFQVTEDATLCISEGVIALIETEPEAARRYTAEVELEGTGRLAMPGFVDCHMNATQELLRGTDFETLLSKDQRRLTLAFEEALAAEDVYNSAMLACINRLRSGITTIAHAGSTHEEHVIQAAIDTGIRATICHLSMDSGEFAPSSLKRSTLDEINRVKELFNSFHGLEDGRISVWFGLGDVRTASPKLIEGISEHSKAMGTGLHAILAQNLDEVAHCWRENNKSLVEWYDQFGALSPNFLGAHAVCLSDREILILRDRQAGVVLCPSNDLPISGFTKLPLFATLEVRVGIGTDGGHNTRPNPLETIRLLKHSVDARYGIEAVDPAVLPLAEVFSLASLGGAQALLIDDDIGSVEVGKKADIILLDIDKPHIFPTLNLARTIVMCAGPEDIKEVIVEGKPILINGEFTTLDYERIQHEASLSMHDLRKRL
jgi:5-methylthioadenosine/S-adenosylhomocysteine deaminase